MAPRIIFSVGWFWGEREKEPITEIFVSTCVWLADQISTRKSPECNFLSEQTSPRINWKVLTMKNGEFIWRDIIEILAVHLVKKKCEGIIRCDLILSTGKRNKVLPSTVNNSYPGQTPTFKHYKGMHIRVPMLIRASFHVCINA